MLDCVIWTTFQLKTMKETGFKKFFNLNKTIKDQQNYKLLSWDLAEIGMKGIPVLGLLLPRAMYQYREGGYIYGNLKRPGS